MKGLNIVEICRQDDKRVHYYVEENRRLGHTVYEYFDKYVTLFHTDLTWNASDVDFKTVASGQYEFKKSVIKS